MADQDQLEGRNVVFEALKRGRRRVHRVLMDERAKRNDKITAILGLAQERGVRVERVPRHRLDRQSRTGVHNGVIAFADAPDSPTTKQLVDGLFERGIDPFVVLVDEARYEHNVGAVLRSCLGAGANGLIIPVRRGKGLSPVVQRVAMGAAEEVPVVREGLSSALATLKRAGVRIVGCDMGGQAVWDTPLTGPIAIVVGGEDKGLTPALRKRCDAVVAVPLQGDLESLNLSVTAAVVLFEKVRQERVLAGS